MALTNEFRVGLCEEKRSFSSNLALLLFSIAFVSLLSLAMLPLSAKAQAARPASAEANTTESIDAKVGESSASDKADQLAHEHNDRSTTEKNSALDSNPRPEAAELVQLTRPTLDISPQLKDDLDAAFKQMRKRLETDDAFSEALGEDYMAYGALLKQAGRLDEATEMFIDALHVAKVNNGVYSIEQRPILKELFDLYFLSNSSKKFEETLKLILWLENKNPEQVQDSTYQLLLTAGNYFIDEHLYEPISGDIGLSLLSKANKYFGYAVKRYSKQPLAERLPPYGELALTNILKSKIEVDHSTRADRHDRETPLKISSSLEQSQRSRFIDETYSRGNNYLKGYFQKAQNEENTPEMVQALLSLGDYNLMFKRGASATYYYKLAWSEAQALPADHPHLTSFEQPLELPAFKYAQPRRTIKMKTPSVYVPLIFDVTKNGGVDRVQRKPKGEPVDRIFNRARRTVRRLTFRPIIEQGELLPARQFKHEVRVKLRAKEVALADESNK